MKLVTTFHQSSSVVGSLKCRLTEQQDEQLVVAKFNRLDVFTLGPEGLRHECDLDIWGRVRAMRAIPVPASLRCNLLVLLDHPEPELLFLTYKVSDVEPPSLQNIRQVSLYERIPRPAEYCTDVLVHPSGRLAVVSCYAGKLKFIFFKNGMYHGDADKLIPEINLLSLCFLDVHEPIVLAILHLDHTDRIRLRAHELDVDVKACRVDSHETLSPILLPTAVPSKLFSLPDGIPKLIPIPPSELRTACPCGVLVVGGSKILLFETATQHAEEAYPRKQQRQKRRSSFKASVDDARDKYNAREDRGRKANASVVWPWSHVAAWCEVERYPGRYLIGDAFGRLAMLSLTLVEKQGLILLPLGQTSPASCLTYLTSQVFYLGSYFGDSQLLRVESTSISSNGEPTLSIPPDINVIQESYLISCSKGKMKENTDANAKGTVVAVHGKRLTLLESFKNIAPIMDAVLADTDASGQPSIVTCSGGQNTGSINIIRKGADFEELAVIDGLLNVTGIWPIRALFKDAFDTHLLVSTLRETLLFSLESNSTVTYVDDGFTGFVSDQATLAVSNVPRPSQQNPSQSLAPSYLNSSLVIQVTTTAVTLVEFEMALDMYSRVGKQWTLEAMAAEDPSWKRREIMAASVNPTQVLLGLNDSRLALLSLDDKDEISLVASIDFRRHEISTVSCVPLSPSDMRAQYFLVAFWVSYRIDILSLTDNRVFNLVCSTNALPALPRSVLLHDFHSNRTNGSDSHHCLLAGLADGTLISLVMKGNTLDDEKVISLGDAPVCVTACDIEEKRAVFACGSRAAILFWDKDRLQHSSVLLKNAVVATPLNTPTFPSCLILSNESRLLIGKVRDINKMHIRSVPLGLDNPRMIAHHPDLKVLAIACYRVEPGRVCDDDNFTCSLRLLDDTTFRYLTQFNFDADERVSALGLLALGPNDSPISQFCVGSYKYRSNEQEPSVGHIHVFNAHSAEISGCSTVGLQLTPKASIDVTGCVYALANLNGMIAAAISASVVIFTLEETQADSVPVYKLRRVTSWNHNYMVTRLVSRGSNLIIGDAINSVSVITLCGTRLCTIARDYGPLWPTSIAAFDDKTVIGANVDYNLFTFSLQTTGTQTVLERDGGFHIDDQIRTFIPGQLTSPDVSRDIQLTPRLLFFSDTGRIGIVIDVGHELSLQLTALQRNMASVIRGVGSSNHTKYRAPRNKNGRSDAETSSFGFLDGDFLEQLLTQPADILTSIQEGQSEAERLTMSLTQMQRVLEALQSMH